MSASARIVFFAINFLFCRATFHEEYRVPWAWTDSSESYVFEDSEYILQKLPVKWSDAAILCRGQHNGTLAVIDTLEKAEFMAEALAESQLQLEAVWVGARRSSDQDPEGYRWAGGAPLRRTAGDVIVGDGADRHYPAWLNRTHVPVPPGGADCVALDRRGHDAPVFLDLPCSLMRPFVCQREAHQSMTVSQLRVVRCRAGLYRVFGGRLTWDQAASYCVVRRMTLANIATMKCLKKLGVTMLKIRPSVESAWVGGRGELGSWSWVDSGASLFSPPATLDVDAALWPPMREPGNTKQNGCLQLDRHAVHPPVFIEARCERKMPFICYEAKDAQALRSSNAKQLAEPSSDDTYAYVLVRQRLYWQQAYDNCRRMLGALAALDSNEVMTQLLLVMGENKEEPVDHIWISGRLNMTKDVATDAVSFLWYNPKNQRRIPDPKKFIDATGDLYMPPWLDEEFSIDNPCLNLDRQNHLSGLIYGIPCDTAQYSVCMIEKSQLAEATSFNPVVKTTSTTTQNPEFEISDSSI